MPNQTHIAAPTVTLAAAESLPRRDSRRIDVSVVATREANDDQNLVAFRNHTDVHSGRVHRSKTAVHEASRPGEYWIRKCLSLRPFSTRDRGNAHGGLLNWLFADTVRGAKASAALYSLISTAKANQLEPYAYLRRLFEAVPRAKNVEDFERLLPFKHYPQGTPPRGRGRR